MKELIICIYVGCWFCLAGIVSTIAVSRSFKDKGDGV